MPGRLGKGKRPDIRNFELALELLRSCGMISKADLRFSLGNLLGRELSSQKDYTSIIFRNA